MTHDIQDLLNLIKELEERIIRLEKKSGSAASAATCDLWYWDH